MKADNLIRRGIKTVEVIAAALATLSMWALSAAQVIPPKYAVYVTAIAVIAVNVSRGLAKVGNAGTNLTNEGYKQYLDHLVQRETIAQPKAPQPAAVVVAHTAETPTTPQ